MHARDIFVLAAACAWTTSAAAAETPGKAAKVESPAPREISYAYDILDNSLVRPFTRVLDVARIGRKVSGHPREAANVGPDDQVLLPSTWWQPRIGFRKVTVEQMMKGPGSGTGPAAGKWTITKAKTQGQTSGFQIKDSKGKAFLVKLDPIGWSDLGTSADVIGSRLMWAAGYNVPDNSIVYFRLEDLEIGKDAKYTDVHRHKKPMTAAFLDTLLTHVDRRPDGTYRGIASKFLEGKPLGPFEYRGRRKDDPEDLIPHELRRELRGLWTVCAWLNHADSRAPNSLDTWVTENGRSFVRHNIIDFSAILGAGAAGPRSIVTGTEYYLDYGVMARQTATLGLAPFRWESARVSDIPSVGAIGSDAFDPVGWRPDYPNPAFDDRTERDIRWGARIVAGFTDEHIRAAVAGARYTDPRATEYITRVLIERRDKIVRQWLGTNPSTMRAGS